MRSAAVMRSIPRIGLKLALLCWHFAAEAQSLLLVHSMAVERSPELRSAAAQLSAAESRERQAKSTWGPNLVLTGSSVRNDQFNQDFEAGERHSSSHSSSLTLQLRQPLVNRSNTIAAEKAARLTEVARTELEAAHDEFTLRVAQAYVDVLSAQEVVEAAQANTRAMASHLHLVQRNFDAGTAIITAVRDAQARLDLARSNEIAAQGELRARRLTLARMAGSQQVYPLALPSGALVPQVPAAKLEAWLAGVQDHHMVRRHRLQLDVARLEEERVRAHSLPIVTAVGSAALNRARPNVAPGTGRATTIGVEVSVPLFDGFGLNGRIAEAAALVSKAQHDLDVAMHGVEESAQRAAVQFETTFWRARALHAAMASSESALRAAELAFREGVGANIDVLNAQVQLSQAQQDFARARYEVLLALLRLRAAAGGLTTNDLREVSELLKVPREKGPSTAVEKATSR